MDHRRSKISGGGNFRPVGTMCGKGSGGTLMRALQLTDGVGLEYLQVVEAPDPEPGPSEGLVRMRAVSLNYPDLLIVNGTYGRGTPLQLPRFSHGCGLVEPRG